jgi:hydroxylaminobenzene mutase
MALVVLGLVMGMLVPTVANPRLGLSAHTGTLMTGILVVAMGAFWARLALSPRTETIAFWLVVDGAWVSSLWLFFAAVFDTSRTTPLHGSAHPAAAWREAFVAAGLTIGNAAFFVGVVLALWGLRPSRT